MNVNATLNEAKHFESLLLVKGMFVLVFPLTAHLKTILPLAHTIISLISNCTVER